MLLRNGWSEDLLQVAVEVAVCFTSSEVVVELLMNLRGQQQVRVSPMQGILHGTFALKALRSLLSKKAAAATVTTTA